MQASHELFVYRSERSLWDGIQAVVHAVAQSDASAAGKRDWLLIEEQSRLADLKTRLDLPDWEQHTGSSQQFHFLSSQIHVSPIIDALKREFEERLSRADHLTVMIDMTWVVRTPSGIVYLREYEAAIARLCQTYPLRSICLYNRNVMPERAMLTGLHTHPSFLTGDGSTAPNPYFVPPNIYAKRDLNLQISYWLKQLDPNADEAAHVRPVDQPKQIYAIETLSILTTPRSEETRWKIRLFGSLRVYRDDGQAVNWNTISGATKKSRTLFAYLLFKGEEGAMGEELADLLWPDSDDFEKSLNRLYHTIRCLRKALSPQLKSSRQSPFILSENQHYYLALPEHSWIDMPLFQEQCYRGRALEKERRFEEAIVVNRSAERLYTGDLLADIPMIYTDNQENDWCWSRRYWFREMYMKMMTNTATLLRQTGQIGDGLIYIEKVLKLDLVSEPANLEKMRLLHKAGRPDAVKRQYRMYRAALQKREMGLPGEEIRQFYKQLKN